MITDGNDDPYALRATPPRESEQVVVKDAADPVALLNLHPAVQSAKARSKSIPGLLWTLAITVVIGLLGIIALTIARLSTDAAREVMQTAIAAEVTLLAVALGRSEST